MLIGYHIVKTAYGRWLPGDARGHWSAVWDQPTGSVTQGGLQEGDAALQRLARSQLKTPPVTLSPADRACVAQTILACSEESDWQIAALAVEPTHFHLLLRGAPADIDSTCKWLAQRTAKAVRRETGHSGPLWGKGKWAEQIDCQEHWRRRIAYINRHPGAVDIAPKAANAIRAASTPNPPPAAPDQDAVDRAVANRGLVIISGGQTGADRAALDFAIAHGIPHAGWCPRGRLAEDGPLAARYQLRETETARYDERTRRNVDQSDATVVFSLRDTPTGGTRLTLDYARRSAKPVLHLVQSTDKPVAAHAAALRGFAETRRAVRLNIAGPRASQSPRIEAFVDKVLTAALVGWHAAAAS